MRRIIFSVMPFFAAGALAWLSGYDFDYRGPYVAFGAGIALFYSILVYIAYPWYTKE